MPVKILKREEILLRLFSVFRRSGFDGATLSKISQETGLGKASLYHHFPGGKIQMAEEVLRFVEDWNSRNLIAPLRGKGKPKQKFKNIMSTFNSMYVGTRRHHQDTSLAQQSSPVLIGQLYPTKGTAVNIGNPVVQGQTFVEKRIVRIQ